MSPKASPTNPVLTPQEALAYLAKHPETLLLDVRQPDEFRRAHMKGARLVPLMTLPTFMGGIPKEDDVVLYCASGGRSGQALGWCIQEGYRNAKHIEGGIRAWIEEGYPVES
jgi:phage shock protein E